MISYAEVVRLRALQSDPGSSPPLRLLLAALRPDAVARAAEISRLPAGQVAVGLADCLAAVNAGAVEVLVVPVEGQAPGYICDRCDALCANSCDCPDWGTATEPVPDLIDKMVLHTIAQDGEVLVVKDVPGGFLAKLRFPVPPGQGS